MFLGGVGMVIGEASRFADLTAKRGKRIKKFFAAARLPAKGKNFPPEEKAVPIGSSHARAIGSGCARAEARPW